MTDITTEEKDLLLAFADNNMSIRQTAEALHVDRRTVTNRLEGIYKRVGADPHRFWTLHYLIAYVLGEEDIIERQALKGKPSGS